MNEIFSIGVSSIAAAAGESKEFAYLAGTALLAVFIGLLILLIVKISQYIKRTKATKARLYIEMYKLANEIEQISKNENYKNGKERK